ncbi:MAG TPA: DUF1134 domain-containing protein [Sphingobium sp.]
MRRNTTIHAVRWARAASLVIAMSGLVLGPMAAPAIAQVRTVDPNTSIDADLTPPPNNQTPPADTAPPAADPNVYDSGASEPPQTASGQTVTPATAPAAPNSSTSYQKDDLIGAAEGVFGKGAQGLAGIIEKILKEQGEPNAYIAGREASGALVVGLRYGSGTLSHKIEGKRDIYWTGPSVGFDAGGNAGNTFVLVYNLYDTQDIYRRFPAGEGAAYFVGGFNASYLRRGDIVLIPIRLGVGYRLGVNAGYMKFTEKRNWVPF